MHRRLDGETVTTGGLTDPVFRGVPLGDPRDLIAAEARVRPKLNLLSRGGRLSAVIDVGTLAVADPAVDLLPAYDFPPPRARSASPELSVTWNR
ncbi:hypothetical protein [Streptomyces sp. NPDC001652]|uniref:hypothetical protein n=1 Tax=Streptomyces sp. NPDC001652 TaxID=3154393 RepID=UPI00332D7670